MNPDKDKILDEYLRGDSALSRQYRDAPRGGPPEALDAAVLANARRAVESGDGRQPVRSMRWLAPLSAAAVVVLAATLVLDVMLSPEIRGPALPPLAIESDTGADLSGEAQQPASSRDDDDGTARQYKRMPQKPVPDLGSVPAAPARTMAPPQEDERAARVRDGLALRSEGEAVHELQRRLSATTADGRLADSVATGTMPVPQPSAEFALKDEPEYAPAPAEASVRRDEAQTGSASASDRYAPAASRPSGNGDTPASAADLAATSMVAEQQAPVAEAQVAEKSTADALASGRERRAGVEEGLRPMPRVAGSRALVGSSTPPSGGANQSAADASELPQEARKGEALSQRLQLDQVRELYEAGEEKAAMRLLERLIERWPTLELPEDFPLDDPREAR